MKTTLLTPALAAILGLALASAPLPTYAQTNTTTTSTAPAPAPAPATATSKKTIGTLTAVDTAGNTISVENKTDGTRTFAIASTAKITVNLTKPATLADFAVGDKVYVRYTTDASGTLTATRLNKKTPKPAPVSASMASPATPAVPATTTTSTPPAQ